MDYSLPKNAGWYWWKAAPTSTPIEVKITQLDVTSEKYNRWGGEWIPFPTLDEVVEMRKKSEEIDQRLGQMNKHVQVHVDLLKKFVDFLLTVQTKWFVPKKKIRAFLDEIKRTT